MSQSTNVLSSDHVRYIAEHTRGVDPFLADLKKAALEAGLPQIAIAPEQASFMQILLRASGVKEVVEVGTLGGFSAISMARALPDGGRVRTVEVNPAHAAFAREWAAKSDVAGKVEVHEGPGVEVLPTFADASADAAFLDADKVNYPRYLEECLRIVRPVPGAFAPSSVQIRASIIELRASASVWSAMEARTAPSASAWRPRSSAASAHLRYAAGR